MAEGFWIRFAITIALAFFAWRFLRTYLVLGTLVGVVLGSLVASSCENAQFAAVALVLAPTLGAFAGAVMEMFKSVHRRRQSLIERRLAHEYVCPECGHKFMSIQSFGQCPLCQRRFARTSGPLGIQHERGR